MNKTITYGSWFVLALALIAWIAVVYGSMWLQDAAKERGAAVLTADQKIEAAAYASRMKGLAQETRAERENLERVTSADIVTIANAIEQAGRSIGVSARVSAAIPAGRGKDIPGGTPLSGISFIVQGEGSFAGVVHLVRVLEKYPGFSEVEQFEFERIQTAQGDAQPWRTSIRLRLMTTSDIAS